MYVVCVCKSFRLSIFYLFIFSSILRYVFVRSPACSQIKITFVDWSARPTQCERSHPNTRTQPSSLGVCVCVHERAIERANDRQPCDAELSIGSHTDLSYGMRNTYGMALFMFIYTFILYMTFLQAPYHHQNMKPALFLHRNCRNAIYPQSKIERTYVADQLVPWTAEFADYQPKQYESPTIEGKPWADPEQST